LKFGVRYKRFAISRGMEKPMFGWVLVYHLPALHLPPGEDEVQLRDCEVRQWKNGERNLGE